MGDLDTLARSKHGEGGLIANGSRLGGNVLDPDSGEFRRAGRRGNVESVSLRLGEDSTRIVQQLKASRQKDPMHIGVQVCLPSRSHPRCSSKWF